MAQLRAGGSVIEIGAREVEDGVRDLRRGDPTALVVGSSHGRTFHAVGQELTPATGYDMVPDGCFLHNGATSRINRPHLVLGDTLTLAGWFYSTNNLQNSNLIYNGHSGSNGYGLFIKKAFTTYGLGNQIVVVQGGLSQDILDTSFHLPLFQWTHIAFVVRKNNFELYINGEFRGSGNRPFNTPDGTFQRWNEPGTTGGRIPSVFRYD